MTPVERWGRFSISISVPIGCWTTLKHWVRSCLTIPEFYAGSAHAASRILETQCALDITQRPDVSKFSGGNYNDAQTRANHVERPLPKFGEPISHSIRRDPALPHPSVSATEPDFSWTADGPATSWGTKLQ
jgi:hypothetical protein